jgi:hypothetical protein
LHAAVPELAHDGYRLVEHLEPHVGRWPPVAQVCSLSASPVPTPRKKRPGIIAADVAAAWAMIAGCVRMRGHVTAVPTRSSVVAAISPIADQTKGLCSCRSTQGWKWSEPHALRNPTSSARFAQRTMSVG